MKGLEEIKFGQGFGKIADIQAGAAGKEIYVVSSGDNGKIYRILPRYIKILAQNILA